MEQPDNAGISEDGSNLGQRSYAESNSLGIQFFTVCIIIVNHARGVLTVKQRENTPPDEVAMVVGRYVIRAEHEHFVADSQDNWEYIPRISRVVRAVSTGLSELHVPADDVTRISAARESSWGRSIKGSTRWISEIMRSISIASVTVCLS